MAPAQRDTPDIAVIGGGAAGFFAALTAAEADPAARIAIYEKGRRFLDKVRVSGGGRCNVTHACFEPAALAAHYPRGGRELRAAFHRWQPRDMLDWLHARGVRTKTEDDGRMFPVTDDSGTIINCFLNAASAAGIALHKTLGVDTLHPEPGGGFLLGLADGARLRARRVCVAAGSLKQSRLADILQDLGHTIEPTVPSLFAFNTADPRIDGLAGVSVPQAQVRCTGGGRPRQGPLLITHGGFSGPAVLRLSAWEARRFHDTDYAFELAVNWLGPSADAGSVREHFAEMRRGAGGRLVRTTPPEGLPRRLWERLVRAAEVDDETKWAALPKRRAEALVRELTDGRYEIRGKTTNKEEFVTCGGVRRKEVDFRTMESKRVPGLFFAGESLDIDGVTGGFNFQSAWTTGRIAGEAMAGTRSD